jgi:hypothetical protein
VRRNVRAQFDSPEHIDNDAAGAMRERDPELKRVRN